MKLPSGSVKEVICLLFHLLSATAKIQGPGGCRAVIAENFLLKQQLVIYGVPRKSCTPSESRSFPCIATVKYARSDGCIFDFYPTRAPLFAPDPANNLPANSEGIQ